MEVITKTIDVEKYNPLPVLYTERLSERDKSPPKNNLNVIIAKTIDLDTFCYECPMCFTSYKNNGEPTTRAKHLIHRHSSENDISNRMEYRISQCINIQKSVIIHITDETRRI